MKGVGSMAGSSGSPDLRQLCNSCKSDEFFGVGGRGDTCQASKFKLFSSGYVILNNVISNTETITAV